uniref:Uncharacterized protein n=1 Tax=Anopheles albimanus TaxID=7167 RepID=A0A182FGY5_ANOAL
MRSLLLLGVLVTASNAFIVQNAPCSGSTVCLINCAVDPRCPIFNPVKPVLLRASTCDRFYKCESGRACEMQCPSGTHYNEREQACDWPTRACCDPSVPCQPDPCGPGGDCSNPAPAPPGPIIPIPPPQPLPPMPSPGVPGPPCSGSTVCLINCALDSRCPVFNPIKPVLLPGQTCDYFYKCESGRACLMRCPDGTHFNTREQACDWPTRACCDPSVPCQPDPCGPGGDCNNPAPAPPTPIFPPPPPPPPPVPVYPPPPNPSLPCGGTGICSSSCPVDNRCPPFNPSKPVLLPASTCERYLKCESGRACPMNCPPGLHFNAQRQICDWPFQACCDPRIECRPNPCDVGGPCNPGTPGPVIPMPPPPPPAPVYPPPPNPSLPCGGTGICSSSCPVDNRCPTFNPSKPVLLPASTCDRYLKCESGRACPMNCPPGLHFNVNTQICDWPFQACCDPSIECRPDPCPPGAFGCNSNQNNNNNNWLWG